MRGLRLVAVVVAVMAAGCAGRAPREMAKAPPGVDVTGTWRGEWVGYGVLEIPREEPVTAELRQGGARGDGRLILEGVSSAESVPLALRHAGNSGSRVVLDVSGADVVMRHELGDDYFVIDLTVEGDRMLGWVRAADPPMYIVMTRRRAGAGVPAAAPTAAVR